VRPSDLRICTALLPLFVGACERGPTASADLSRNLRDLCRLAAVQVTFGFVPTTVSFASSDTVWTIMRFSPTLQRSPPGPTGCSASGTVSATSLLPLGVGGPEPRGSFAVATLEDRTVSADSIGMVVTFSRPNQFFTLILGLAPADRGNWTAIRDSSVAEGVTLRR
jgi:hypothetical protein